jgi:hypothetical protein
MVPFLQNSAFFTKIVPFFGDFFFISSAFFYEKE